MQSIKPAICATIVTRQPLAASLHLKSLPKAKVFLRASTKLLHVPAVVGGLQSSTQTSSRALIWSKAAC